MRRLLGNRLAWRKGRRAMCYAVSALLLAIAGVSVLLGFTHEKARKIEVLGKKEEIRAENVGCMGEEKNPLERCGDARLVRAVGEYYKALAKEENFAEGYDSFRIYTKKGQYQDTWVVFIRYHMKIKDIYTEVPGLGILFAEREGEDGAYKLSKSEPEGQTKEYVGLLAEHEDVKALFQEAEEEYQRAVGSDALLQEAITDLEKASEEVDR